MSGFYVILKHKPPTQRGILSVVGSVFDPFGSVAPFILTGKKILQDLYRIKLGWDNKVSTEHCTHWQRWLSDVPKLSHFMIDRCFKPADFMEIVSSQFHHFYNASEIGCGSVPYLWVKDRCGRIHYTILQRNSPWSPLGKSQFLA